MTIRGPFNFEARQLVLFGAAAIVLLVFLFGPTSTNLLSKSLRMSAIGNPSIPGFMLCLFACHGRQLRV
jgi:hypothetical protein